MSGPGGGNADGRSSKEPVNLATGNLFLPSTDVRIPGRGPGLELTRTFNSQVITHFPHNWDTGLGTWVVENGEASGEGGQNWHPRTWGDFELTLKMKTLAQDPEGTLPDLEFYTGWIHFRFKDYENQYQLLIKTTGVVELVKYYVENGVQERYFWRRQTTLSPFNWNTLTIRMQGGQIKVVINGVTIFNIVDPAPLPAGRIGLEAHRSHVHWDDFTLTDLSTGQSHTHTFDDIPNQEGMFGYGWTSNLEMRIIEDLPKDGMTMIVREDGRQDHFTRNPDGSYTASLGIHDQLSKTTSGYTLRRKDGLTWSFDVAGQLTALTDRNGNALTLTRDLQGRVAMVTDSTGRKLTFAYGTNGKVATVADPAGRQWTYTYDAARHLIKVTHPLRLIERYSYSSLTHNLTSYTDKTGAIFRYTYTIDDRVRTQTDPNGKVTTFTWQVPFAGLGGTATTLVTNALGQTWSYRFKLEDEVRPEVHDQIHVITDPFGNTEGFAWDVDKNRIGKTDESDRSVFWEYDAQGNPTKIIQFVPPAGSGLSSVSILQYEPTFNQLTALYDPNEHETHFEYDARGNLTRLWRPFNYVDRVESTFTYNAFAEVVTATDPLGRSWSFIYDTYGNRISATDPLGHVTTATYDILGRPTSITDVNGHTTLLTWDAGDRLIKVTDPVGNQTITTYNGNGQPLSVTDPEGNKTTFAYDKVGNLIWVTDPLLKSTTYTWDTADFMHRGTSRLASVTDAKGKITRYGYDARGRLIQVTDPLGKVTKYGYDQATHVTSITDVNGRVTSYSYDDLERLRQVIDPLGNVTMFTYDRLGHLTGKTDPEGRATTHTYDELDRLTKVTYSDGTSVTYTYDKAGNRIQMADSTGTTRYTYDPLNRLTSVTTPDGRMLTYSYDPMGNRTGMTSFLGTTRYDYDPLDRLSRLTDPQGGIYDFGYDRASRRTSSRFPNGLATTYAYDASGRLTQFKTANASLQTILNMVYTYDSIGNVLSIARGPTGTPAAGTTTYAYDALNQLIEVTYPNSAMETFTYDGAGNRLTANGVASTYDSANRLLTAGSVTYTYDKVGNRTTQSDPTGGSMTFTYDGANRLKGGSRTPPMPAPPQPAFLYTYDGDGNRVAKSAQGMMTRYLYDGPEVLAEFGSTSMPGLSYTHGPGLDELLATRNQATNQILYHLTDHLGSTIALVDASQQVQTTFTYAAFGVTRSKSGSQDTRFRFTGRELDTESNLYHYRARAYDPAVGRFLQPDPWPRTPADPRMMGLNYYARLVSTLHPLPGAVPGFLPAGLPAAVPSIQAGFLSVPIGLNAYPYVLNNPLRLTDPLGLEGRKLEGAGRAFLIAFGSAAAGEMMATGAEMIGTGNPVGIVGGLIAIGTGGLLLYIIGSG